MRQSRARRAILTVLLGPGPHYGLDIARDAQVLSGILYAILARLEWKGWVGSDWEEQAPSADGEPRRRRHYYLTLKGTYEALRIQRERPPRRRSVLFRHVSLGLPRQRTHDA
jgi:DNA-binding PadR family transcriptional regulator